MNPIFNSPDRLVPKLRVLQDDCDLCSDALRLIEPSVELTDSSSSDTVGILSWERASIREVASLQIHRASHAGPIVAILRSTPLPRGARAVSALLDGAVLEANLEVALLPTLLAVVAGQSAVPRVLRKGLDRPALSARERQVLAMVVLDFSNADIARKLVVTESNVKSHLTSAFSKLGVSSRNAATALILDHESGLGTGVLRILPEE